MSAVLSTELTIPDDLKWAHPIVQEWFVRKFGTPTEPQIEGWPHILSGRTTLISAPTGSGKTLSAFLACLDRLIRKSLSGQLEDKTEVLYISPLKALGNDIQKNLEAPLAEIMELAAVRGMLMPPVRTAVRSGDTPVSERRKMLLKPPHILVTTPESFYILLTAESSRKLLRTVETVIVDEIHAIADDKRGAHLALSLERLDVLTSKPATRIGLSATQRPIELVAEFLTGCKQSTQSATNGLLPTANSFPPVAIVDVGHHREMDLAIEVPSSALDAVCTHTMWDEIYDRIAALAKEHRSTLIFVNTRAMAERLAHNLAPRIGEELVAAHHGSLSRKLRLTAEKKLKNGEIRALVATASLELGIDIGTVDLMCHISSPRSIAVMRQRVGRAGHWRGAIPKGRFFPTTRDELIELSALVRAMRRGELDRLEIPDAPMDILAQQIVAMCACQADGDEWLEKDLFTVVRGAYPYRDLTLKQFDDILTMLSEGIAASRGRFGAYLYRDKVGGRLRARRGSRHVAITNGGAIPDTALFSVIAEPEGLQIATLDEDFAVESSAGEIILLGNTSWRIRRIENTGKVFVEDAHGAAPTIPFWRGEAPGRTDELSAEVSFVREKISALTPGVSMGPLLGVNSEEISTAKLFLSSECGLDDRGAEQAIEYVVTARAILNAIPATHTVVAERFFDEGGGMQLVIHAPFGARINKAWGLALRKKFCRSFNFELQAQATENGLNISLAEQHSFPLEDVFRFLTEENCKEALEQASLDSPMFANRWRWDAGRSLTLVRFRNGKKVPPQILRMRSDDLLATVFPQAAACQENIVGTIEIPDHPLVNEVIKDVLTEAMDLVGLKRIIRGLYNGDIRFHAVDTPVPSVFSHEILNANPFAYLDDAPIEERRARAVQMRRSLPESVLSEIGKLDPAAIAQVREECWPDVRDADDLHDALLTLTEIPERFIAIAQTDAADTWGIFFSKLISDGRAARAYVGEYILWVCAERAQSFALIHPKARWENSLPAIETTSTERSEAMFKMVQGWSQHTGPITSRRLSETLAVPVSDVLQAFYRLESMGSILRGSFEFHKPEDEADIEWCDRRLLARIHRMTLGTLRKQVEPVSSGTFMRWLLRWQHMAPGTQLAGERGLLAVLRQLQGFEVPANAWEKQLIARRLHGYKTEMLDHLCLTGAAGWGRLSPHPATLDSTHDGRRRVVPTSVAPITFFLRDEAEWMSGLHQDATASLQGLSGSAKKIADILQNRGACFFPDLVRMSELLKSEVETALWELVAAGRVTADGFDNLRALIDPKRRSGQGTGKSARPRHSAGRWTLLYPEALRAEKVDPLQRVEAVCRMLLSRYGVVFRELLARESILPKWRELSIIFRRLEDRGELRGGRFVNGFVGEQFALPECVEGLRMLRRQSDEGGLPDEIATISAADPLNLAGILVPGERVPAISGRFLTFKNGAVVTGEESVTPLTKQSN